MQLSRMNENRENLEVMIDDMRKSNKKRAKQQGREIKKVGASAKKAVLELGVRLDDFAEEMLQKTDGLGDEIMNHASTLVELAEADARVPLELKKLESRVQQQQQTMGKHIERKLNGAMTVATKETLDKVGEMMAAAESSNAEALQQATEAIAERMGAQEDMLSAHNEKGAQHLSLIHI